MNQRALLLLLSLPLLFVDKIIKIKPSRLLALELVFQWLQPLGKLLNISLFYRYLSIGS